MVFRPALPLLLLLTSCVLGKNFQRPDAPAAARYGAEPAGNFTYGSAIDATWWDSFGDPELTSLVGRLATQNLDLQAAAERVQQGRAQTQVIASDRRPHLDANGSYMRERQSPTGVVSLFEPRPGAPLEIDLWQDSLMSSWELDLFGRIRRAEEAARANTEAQIEARHGLALMAIADLAQDYVQLRGTQAMEAITDTDLADADKNLALVQVRFDNGVSTTLDLANARAQRAGIASMLPTLRAAEARLINAIGLLLSEPPRALEAELSRPAPEPAPPPSVPLGVPGELARRRPDVREAEATLHAATAETGVAVASFYPDVSLMGSAGTQSLNFTRLFDLHSAQFSVGPSIDIPLFEGGRLRATLTLRQSQQREAALRFQSTVLQAWRDVDDAMTAYAQARARRADVAEQLRQSELALAAARQRYDEGVIDFLNVIAAQTVVLQSRGSLVDADTQIETDLVGLYKALGGGWQVADR